MSEKFSGLHFITSYSMFCLNAKVLSENEVQHKKTMQ